MICVFLADSVAETTEKAIGKLRVNSQQQYKVNLKNVDDGLLLDGVNGYYIHLEALIHGSVFRPERHGYKLIGE
ncbi:Uncharacterised protein [Yersinia nurmii]|uniref:Uncharacterized protein n=1 Tax=Yersinia nurmii TaxID=685706 RepID=A0ABM9S7X9_9GAMM|nr:Uncharacterised protein [Yersinia nurmii]